MFRVINPHILSQKSSFYFSDLVIFPFTSSSFCLFFIFTFLFFSSVRTWCVVSPVPVSIECDLKTLLASYSFQASVLLNDKSSVIHQFTTAEQRVKIINSFFFYFYFFCYCFFQFLFLLLWFFPIFVFCRDYLLIICRFFVFIINNCFLLFDYRLLIFHFS